MSKQDLSFLVIGLGSMGKRRIRNLMHLGYRDIAGFDPRADRCQEVESLFNLKTFSSFKEASARRHDAYIISVPPDTHHIYMTCAFEKGIHFFVEASVVDHDFETLVRKANEGRVVAAPSCTLCFHPAVKKITEIMRSGELGSISTVLYHSGQYLPDWHSYERVDEYYVSKKETGGAREIVPFELSWITNSFGFPSTVSGIHKKTIDIVGAEEIDDTYSFLAEFDSFILNLTVDVVSRYATRRLVVNGGKKQLYWSWDAGKISLYDPAKESWLDIPYDALPSKEGYNKNITEQMYIEEIEEFIRATQKQGTFRNSMEHDWKVLKVLYAVEESYRTKKFTDLKWTA